MLLEVICQVALIDEARHGRYERWRCTFSEKLARSLDANLDEILMRRQSGRFPERANDSEGCHSSALRKHVERGFIGSGIGILEHLSYDAHDARLVPTREPPVQSALRAPACVTSDQFSDRNAGGFLGDGFVGGDFVMIDGGIRLPTSVSIDETIGGADYAIESLIRASNHWVAEDEDAELRRRFTAGACGFRVQHRQLNGKMNCEIGKGLNARAHAPRMHFARRYHHRIAGANEAFCSATPK